MDMAQQVDSSPVASRPQKIRCLNDVVMAASSQFWLDHLHTLEVLRFQIVSKSASHWIKTADHLEPLSIIKLPSTQYTAKYTAKYNELKDRDVVTDQALSCLWSICGDQIRSIELNFLNITGRGLKFLFDRSPHLHTISLTHCRNIDGATLMDNLLSSTLKSLRSVRLNGISLVENDLQRLCDRGEIRWMFLLANAVLAFQSRSVNVQTSFVNQVLVVSVQIVQTRLSVLNVTLLSVHLVC